jgi:NAD(P)H dehydrogenase (quinone)
VRSPEKAKDLTARGIAVRQADYSKPETLPQAFAGAEKVLLISSNEVGQRAPQHAAVVDAAKGAGVRLLAYTSILRAETSKLAMAAEHKATEAAIRASGVPFVLLRNSWYTENYTENLGPALEHGAIVGSADGGRIAAATRADYADAAVAALTAAHLEKDVYELAGDRPFTMTELAAEVSRQVGKTIVYKDLPPAEHRAVLIGAGLPAGYADLLVDTDLGVARASSTTRRASCAASSAAPPPPSRTRSPRRLDCSGGHEAISPRPPPPGSGWTAARPRRWAARPRG